MKIWQEAAGLKAGIASFSTPLPQMSYHEAMKRYGSDKPDTRYGLEIQDVSTYFDPSTSTTCAINAKHLGRASFSRKDVQLLVEFIQRQVGKSSHIAVSKVLAVCVVFCELSAFWRKQAFAFSGWVVEKPTYQAIGRAPTTSAYQ